MTPSRDDRHPEGPGASDSESDPTRSDSDGRALAPQPQCRRGLTRPRRRRGGGLDWHGRFRVWPRPSRPSSEQARAQRLGRPATGRGLLVRALAHPNISSREGPWPRPPTRHRGKVVPATVPIPPFPKKGPSLTSEVPHVPRLRMASAQSLRPLAQLAASAFSKVWSMGFGILLIDTQGTSLAGLQSTTGMADHAAVG